MGIISKVITGKLLLICSVIFWTQTNTIIMAQNTYKNVNEVKGIPVGTKVDDFSATDQNDYTFHL